MATLMSDEVFHDVAYKAKNRNHLLAGIDEFLDAVTVLPPGEWDPTIRIEPPAAIPSQVRTASNNHTWYDCDQCQLIFYSEILSRLISDTCIT